MAAAAVTAVGGALALVWRRHAATRRWRPFSGGQPRCGVLRAAVGGALGDASAAG